MLRRVKAGLGAVLGAAVVMAGLVVPAPRAAAADMDGFDPGNLVTDAVFFDPSRFSPSQVRAFLDEKGQNCTPSASGVPCLKDYRTNTPATKLTPYCTAIPARTSHSAAGIISDVAGACSINPQMLILLIQRESSLITASGARLTTTAYARATGAGCPDYLGCDETTATFFWQVYAAAERFQIYKAQPHRFNHKVGVVNKIQYNPEARCGTADVRIRNQATAGLYNYTPYVPNKASLDRYPGEGDLCSSYGQRNFSYYLKRWFKDSAPATSGPITYPRPASTITRDMTAIYARMAELKLSRVGSSTSMILPGRDAQGRPNGTYYKTFGKLSMVWTPTRGATLSYQVPRATQPPLLPRFRDVATSNQFTNEIEWLRAMRISEGWADGTYRPVQPVQRAAMAAFLYRAAGQPAYTPPKRASFRDVPVSHQFFKEVEWLKATGVTTGYSDGTFKPWDSINRDAMAAFLYRAAGRPAYTPPAKSSFTDMSVGTQFRKEIEWLATTGITKGWDDGTFRPLSPVNRDAMAAFLYRRAG